jgi:hypothetical protein
VRSQIGKEKDITPLDFRRLIPSIIFAEELVPEGLDLTTFLRDYAELVNTSFKVLLDHYIKSNSSKKSTRAQSVIETIVTSKIGMYFLCYRDLDLFFFKDQLLKINLLQSLMMELQKIWQKQLKLILNQRMNYPMN